MVSVPAPGGVRASSRPRLPRTSRPWQGAVTPSLPPLLCARHGDSPAARGWGRLLGVSMSAAPLRSPALRPHRMKKEESFLGKLGGTLARKKKAKEGEFGGAEGREERAGRQLCCPVLPHPVPPWERWWSPREALCSAAVPALRPREPPHGWGWAWGSDGGGWTMGSPWQGWGRLTGTVGDGW